jgi:hypothetical protein
MRMIAGDDRHVRGALQPLLLDVPADASERLVSRGCKTREVRLSRSPRRSRVSNKPQLGWAFAETTERKS